MNGWRKNALRLPVSLITTALLTPLVFSSSVIAETTSEPWYQVDVVLFKPSRVDLDDESWPEFELVYPEDLVAVTAPRPFNLSQLEQIGNLAPSSSDEPIELPGSDEFVFQSQGNRERNRQIIESLEADTGETGNKEPVANIAEANLLISDERPEEADDTIPAYEPDPYSAGNLAFSAGDESSLQKILRSLRRSSRFEVLGHYSWIQPINNEPTPVMMQTGDRYDNRYEVEGTLAFSRSRYLHVDTDLWYTSFEPRGNSNPYTQVFESSLDDELLSTYKDLVDVERNRGQYFPARVHRMLQSRRMRSAEMHYLDHPLFGVIVKINRYEIERDETTEAARVVGSE